MGARHIEIDPPALADELIIPFLPRELATVPRSPLSPDDPQRYAKALAWHAWREGIIRFRIQRRAEVQAKPDLMAVEMAMCAKSWAYWICIWGFIFEPRNADNEAGEVDDDAEFDDTDNEEADTFIQGDTLHWIPFDRQIECVRELNRCLRRRGSLAHMALSKSREVGASWVVVSWCLHKWLFAKSWTCLWLSRNEDYVESSEPKSLFWKCMFLFDNLPRWMIPQGFNRRKHKTKLRLAHPDGKKYIVGESANQNAGRGNRVSFALMDEAAFFQGGMARVWSGLINTTRHVAAVSTESLEFTEDFTRLANGEIDPPPTRFAWDWWQCPYHLDEWFKQTRDSMALEPWRFDQEVLRNAQAGITTLIYSQATHKQARHDIIFHPGAGTLICGIDPGQRDHTALIWGQDSLIDGKFNCLESYENNYKPAGFYASIMNGVPRSEYGQLYGEREIELMDLIRRWAVSPTYYGDTYGFNSLGAQADSFYDVLASNDIFVDVERTPAGVMTAMQNSHRFRPGRREAVRQLLPRTEFADSIGALSVLRALKRHKFKPIAPNSTTMSDEPVKDDTVHLVAAFEYIAVNMRDGSDFAAAVNARNLRAGGGDPGAERGNVESGLVYLH